MIRIKDEELARRFCRTYSRRGALSGAWCWSADKWLQLANAMLAGQSDVRAAELLAPLKARAKSLTINGCFCQKCGKALSAPESVAAMVGPECMGR